MFNLIAEQISHTVLKGVISFKTIYRWIFDGTILSEDLMFKTKRKASKTTRNTWAI